MTIKDFKEIFTIYRNSNQILICPSLQMRYDLAKKLDSYFIKYLGCDRYPFENDCYNFDTIKLKNKQKERRIGWINKQIIRLENVQNKTQ